MKSVLMKFIPPNFSKFEVRKKNYEVLVDRKHSCVKYVLQNSSKFEVQKINRGGVGR
jgi:hypothetical protein